MTAFTPSSDPRAIAREVFATDGVIVEDIPSGGSDRVYFRIAAAGDNVPWILCFYDARKRENRMFVDLTLQLDALGVRVPNVIRHDEENCWYVMEDLGRRSLCDYATDPSITHEQRSEHYRRSLRTIAHLHAVKEDALPDRLEGMMEQVFNEDLYLWEQGYFFEHLAGTHLGMPKDVIQTMQQSDALQQVAKNLDSSHPRCLVHRDFQSENIIPIVDGAALIDYQGVRLGLPEYDVASLLYDPYVDLQASEIDDLIDFYYAHIGIDRAQRKSVFTGCAVQRLMQALGAYGNLGHNLGKPRYLGFIPTALDRLKAVSAGTPIGEALTPLFLYP